MYYVCIVKYTDTTDVQSVRVVATGIDTQVQVECDFIPGSDADGCVVVLVSSGEVDNTTLNITRQSNSSNIAETGFELLSPLYCYSEAYALDIEADGSTGTLPIHGVLDHTDANTDESCLPTDVPLRPRSEYILCIMRYLPSLVPRPIPSFSILHAEKREEDLVHKIT